jgi:hypothetical protein
MDVVYGDFAGAKIDEKYFTQPIKKHPHQRVFF